MTATEELRRLLDERGVKWDELQSYEGGKMTRWRDSMGRYVTAYDEGMVTFFDDFYWQPTVRQAVDATLGRGTCRDLAETPKYGDKTRFECSACGYEYSAVGGFGCDYGDEPDFRYCPNCGREVVDE